MLSSTFLLLLLFTTFPSSIEAVKCGENVVCIAASKFDENTLKADKEKDNYKSCDDGCAVFWCLLDHKKIMLGGGCYSDYEKVCKDAPAEAKFNVTEITADPTFKKAPNNMVIACNTENCILRSFELLTKIGDFFSNEFLDGIDKSSPDTCEYPASNGFMNQMEGFKLLEMILSGLILAQFW